MTVRSTVALLAVCTSCASANHPRLFDAPRSFTIAEENDAFGFGKTDHDYTQGLRLGYDFAVWSRQLNVAFRPLSLLALGGSHVPAISRACTADVVAKHESCGQFALTIGQTEYTPTELVKTELVRTERPYAGYLWAGFARTALFRRAQVTSEIDVGLVGPHALAREGQSLAHWTWSSDNAAPQGWHNQLGDMLQLSLVNQYAFRVFEACGRRWDGRRCTGGYNEARWIDFAPHATLTAGTLMTRASGGATLRVGMRMPQTMMRQNIVVSRTAVAAQQPGPPPSWWKRHRLWFMGIVSGDENLVGHNALLSGTRNDGGPGEWREQRQIRTRRQFGEWSFGAGVGMSEFTLIYQRVSRGAEYDPLPAQPTRPKHRYGSITISIHQPARDPLPAR